jgi:hypothetical protein
MNTKSPIDFSGTNPAKLISLNENSSYTRNGVGKGFANTKLFEPLPKFINSESEKVLNGSNNTYIVLGRDRPSSRFSGYGGRGDTQAGAIDIVAGRMGHLVKEVGDYGEDVYTDPDFVVDAARIYIAQKTDIDKNFKLTSGKVGSTDGRSAIGIKADGVRIIGREGIKLITKPENINSRGGDINSVFGIDLIANNDDSDLQSIPKGQNLLEALEKLLNHHKDLCSIVENFITYQMKINQSVIAHVHVGNLAVPTSPSFELMATAIPNNIQILSKSLLMMLPHRTNIEMYKMNYLTPIGDKYINSRHNNTN